MTSTGAVCLRPEVARSLYSGSAQPRDPPLLRAQLCRTVRARRPAAEPSLLPTTCTTMESTRTSSTFANSARECRRSWRATTEIGGADHSPQWKADTGSQAPPPAMGTIATVSRRPRSAGRKTLHSRSTFRPAEMRLDQLPLTAINKVCLPAAPASEKVKGTRLEAGTSGTSTLN